MTNGKTAKPILVDEDEKQASNARWVAHVISCSRSANTRRTYASAWKRFEAFCAEQKCPALPASPQTIAVYLTGLAAAGRAFRTIDVHRSAIALMHRQLQSGNPIEDPAIQEVIEGLSRTLGRRPKRQARPLEVREIVSMLDVADRRRNTAGLRDAALCALGFLGALRRSELASLCVEDLTFEKLGLWVCVRRSKTDPSGRGQMVPILDGPRLRVSGRIHAWLRHSDLGPEAPLFVPVNRGGALDPTRSLDGRDVNRIVQRYARSAGLDLENISAHSLRAGFVTCAVRAGARLDKLRAITRHQDLAVLMNYARDPEAFHDHPAASFA